MTLSRRRRAEIYARVSTLDQEPENQLAELRRHVQACGWTATEFVDRGISGTRDHRPALDTLLKDVKRRRFGPVEISNPSGRSSVLLVIGLLAYRFAWRRLRHTTGP